MSGEGLKGVTARMAWTDEAWASWSGAVRVDPLNEWQRAMLNELAKAGQAMRRVGDAAGRLTEVFEQGEELAEELAVGGGWSWSSVEAKTWARERVPGARADEEVVAGFWNGERVAPGFASGFGRGGRRPSAVSSPRMQKVRLGTSVYAWVPDGLSGGRMVTEASRRPRQRVPDGVLEAERRLKAADEAAGEFVEMMARLGHAGPVTGPGLNLVASEEEKTLTVESTDWECQACGAVSGDEELFAELGCDQL